MATTGKPESPGFPPIEWEEEDLSTRPLPLHQPEMIHGSLVVDLCDLIREARGLGY